MKGITIYPEFPIGTTVYAKAAVGDEKLKVCGIVCCLEIYPGDAIMYDVRWGDNSRGSYYDFELTTNGFSGGEEDE